MTNEQTVTAQDLLRLHLAALAAIRAAIAACQVRRTAGLTIGRRTTNAKVREAQAAEDQAVAAEDAARAAFRKAKQAATPEALAEFRASLSREED